MMGQLFFCIKNYFVLEGLWITRWIFFKAYQSNQYIMYMHRRILNFQAALWKRKLIFKSLLSSLKTVTNAKKPHHNFCSCIHTCCHWSIFSSVHHSRLSEHISEYQAAFGTTFSVTGGYLKAGIGFMKRVTGKIFKISKCFQRSKQKL